MGSHSKGRLGACTGIGFRLSPMKGASKNPSKALVQGSSKAPEDVNINTRKRSTRSQKARVEEGSESEDEEVPRKVGPPSKPKTRETGMVPLPKRVEFVEPPVAEERPARSNLIPFIDVPRMDPALKKSWDKAREAAKNAEEPIPVLEKKGPAYTYRAPVEDEAKIDELIAALKEQQIAITQGQLLAVMDPHIRKKLIEQLSAKRVPTGQASSKKAVSMVEEVENENPYDYLKFEELPEPQFRILDEDEEGMPKGSIVMNDPVTQYLNNLAPEEAARKVIVARESYHLKALHPIINGVATVESLLDGGSQIISMSREAAVRTSVAWDPQRVINMESANKQVEPTLGLAKNVPFNFGDITVYLQIHIMANPAYDVLLGRPFEVLTASVTRNETDGTQIITLTDPNTKQQVTMPTYDRGRGPRQIRREPDSINSFQASMI